MNTLHIANTGSSRGFTLLVAAVLASVAVSVGITLAHLSAQQLRLAGNVQDSEYAFYAASSGLECVVAADQRTWNGIEARYGSAFDAQASETEIRCYLTEEYGWSTLKFYHYSDGDYGRSFLSAEWTDESGSTHYNGGWFPIGDGCAEAFVTKGDDGRTNIFVRGANVCDFSNPDKVVERGLTATY